MTQASLPPWPKPDWPVVQTEAGPITLAPVTDINERVQAAADWGQKAAAEVETLQAEKEDKCVEAGAILVPRSKEWSVPPELQSQVARAQALVASIDADDQQARSLKTQESSGGPLQRLGAWRQEHAVEHDRDKASGELRQLLFQIGATAPPTAIPEVEELRKVAGDLQNQSTALASEFQVASDWAKQTADEIGRRAAAVKEMGFDSLYETAVLQTSGPQPVQSPLVLKAGEQAYESVPATFARMVTKTHYVGGSTGFSFPIGHTGIRYRVGAFRGQPVQQQSLTRLDEGTLVLTNQRVAYIGSTKSTAVPLAKVMHVEVYNDGLAIFQEGKENPDFYFIPAPQRFLFLMNWFLSRSADGTHGPTS